ncbi:NAD(P)-binding protein [Phanerochaete sordida]|uniref:NAD(P)-binding protein n=1 Tax=Phanerochaete sordida TaxID=48140 RepID=A0A9P3LA08_9APHY|nr:NAD(P)-binding protein [Phanerochaete sordida]
MKLLILGATGPCGQLLIQDALAAGHSVVVFARSPQKLPESITSNPAVTVVQGQLTDAELISKTVAGVHAVLSALGPPVTVTSGLTYPSDTPIAKGYALVIDAMKRHGVRRLILLGTTSIKDANDHFSVVFKTLVAGVGVFAHGAYKDFVAIGELVRSESVGLDWTIGRVPVLTSGEDKSVVVGYVGDKHRKPVLTRTAFASWVLEELEKGEWVGKAPLITSP